MGTLSEAGRFMMFWMAYGSASGGLVRQRVSLHAWVAIWPPTEFGADKEPLFLNKRRSAHSAGIVSCPSKTTCIFDLFVVPGFLQGCFSRFFSAPLASSSLRFLSAGNNGTTCRKSDSLPC